MGLQEVVFLAWLGEKLALEAAAEHQDLWLPEGELICVCSSMGNEASVFQIQGTLQRSQHSAVYRATCCQTQEDVVVKLGPAPDLCSQAELLRLDRGAWGQVLLRCSHAYGNLLIT